jgi:uncharacterized protein with HEPN domain
VSRALYERLCDIKERCEQLVEDLHGDPASVGNDRVLAKAVLYDLHVIGEACGALPDEFRARHGDVDWKGWKDFRNLTTHQYWRADATIAAEAMERAIPVMVAVVAAELPIAADATLRGFEHGGDAERGAVHAELHLRRDGSAGDRSAGQLYLRLERARARRDGDRNELDIGVRRGGQHDLPGTERRQHLRRHPDRGPTSL